MIQHSGYHTVQSMCILIYIFATSQILYQSYVISFKIQTYSETNYMGR